MERGIKNRVIKGFGANAFGQIVVVLIQLAGVPILLHFWGAQLYGEWLILFSIPAYLSMTDLGFSQSAGNDMTARVARNERVEALAVFQSLAVLVFGAAAIGFALVSAVICTLPLAQWLHFEIMSTFEARLVLWMLAIEALIKLTEGISHAGFRANGDYALHRLLNYLTLLVQFAGVWLVAVWGGGPVVAAFAFVAVRAIVTPAVAILLSYRHAWIYLGFRYAQVGRLRALFWPATANVCFPLAQALNLQGMVLVVGSTLGPLAVVTFSTLRTLSRFAFQPVLSISHAAEPEMASAYGNPDLSLLRKLYLHSLRASLWMALCCACFLTLTGEWVLNLWTHGRVQMDVALFHWLLATAVASVLWYGPLMVLKAANRHLSASVLYVSVSCGAIVLAGLLLGARGNLAIIGLPMLVIDIVMGGYALRAAARLCGCTTLAGLKAALNPRPLFKLALVKSHVH